jgi:hypothetical protein
MKNNLKIAKNGLTNVVFLYYQKYYPFIKHCFFKKMVIEMLLNNDIQNKIVQMILQFQKKINVMMHIIEKKLN